MILITIAVIIRTTDKTRPSCNTETEFVYRLTFLCFKSLNTNTHTHTCSHDECLMPLDCLYYAVPHNCYTLSPDNISFYFVQLLFIFFLLFSFSYALFHTFITFISERVCTPLQYFYKGSIRLDQ